jgi:predicted O-linked N-acetylglucosamine transferase (SPINDLY family)
LEEYETVAIRLSKKPDELADIRKKLENHRLTTPLFDTPAFAKDLERAYVEIMKRFYAGQSPEHIFPK